MRHASAGRHGRFDLVTANTLARPLMRLAPSLARVLAPRGTMILSGLLVQDVPRVLAAYAEQGLRLEKRSIIEGWATLKIKKGGVGPRPARLRIP